MIFTASALIIAFESVVSFVIVTGNLIVIYAMTREKMIDRKSNIYILSVAVADLLMGLINVPMLILNVSFESLSSQY